MLRRPSSSHPLTRTSASSTSRSCLPPFSTVRTASNATRPFGMLLGSAQAMAKSARWVPRRLWRLGWTGPGRGTARLATNSSTSPITYTLARARVTTSRQKTLLTHVTPHSRRHTSSFLDTRRSALAAQHICLISNLRRTGHDGAFRPVGHRAQPSRLLQRKHGLVRARCLARGPNFFVLMYAWPRLGLWRLSISRSPQFVCGGHLHAFEKSSSLLNLHQREQIT